MRLSLTAKVFFAVLALSLALVLAMATAAQISFSRGFLGYLREQETLRLQVTLPPLEAAYREHGSWDFLHRDPTSWMELMRPEGATTPVDGVPTRGPPIYDLTGANMRFTLRDAAGRFVFGNPGAGPIKLRRPVQVDGKTVGWLEMLPFQQVTEAGDLRFQRAQIRASWMIALIAMLLIAALSAWLARALAAPMRRLAGATHALAAGDYAARVPVVSVNEIGQLERDFNQLALTLERNERMRREFVADVSHELRTPLAVVRGELEALEDGVRPLDQQAVRSLQAEVAILSKLVDDLYDLSLVDVGALRYRKVELDLLEVIRASVAGHAERLVAADILLTLELPEAPLWIDGDEARLQQVFGNLLENSLRYTDPGGVLMIRAEARDGEARIDLMDSAPGVPDALLPRLFERFYRVESSRNRAMGGAGLGLPICRSIIEAHGGRIEVRPSPRGGLWIAMTLPMEVFA